MSYKLDLPAGSQIHPVFHVSNLKAKLGAQVVPRPALPAVSVNQILNPEPVAILATKSHQLRSRLITQVLVQWQDESKEDATWENLCIAAKVPSPCGQGALKGRKLLGMNK